MSEDKEKPEAPKGGSRRPRTAALAIQVLIWCLFLAMLLAVFTVKGGPWSRRARELSVIEFKEMLDAGKVEKALYRDAEISGTLMVGGEGQRVDFTVKVPPSFWTPETIAEIGEKVLQPASWRYSPTNPLLVALLVNGLPWLILIVAAYFLIFRPMKQASGTGSAVAFGRSRAKLARKTASGVTFNDVAGVDEAKEEVAQLVECLKNPGKFRELGARVPRGVLLTGYPGTGKTLLAKAIAGEADVPFFSICGSDFVEMFVGVGAARVRDLFKQAHENSPCILFLDEIDAVGRRRGTGLGGGHDEREQTLNAILVEMDGFERDEGVIVIASTNRPDVLDPALLRPGRFDREITLDLPDLQGREAILEVHARQVKIGPDVDMKVVARSTPGFSGAELAALVNEGAMIAAMRGKKQVSMDELEEARDKIRFGTQKRKRSIGEADRLVTAYHEAGHSVVQFFCPETEPVHKVTIIPRGRALGMTMSLPEKDQYHIRRRQLEQQIIVCLSGRAAEELFCDDITAGAENDLQTATKIVRLMVCRWGMSEKVGMIACSDNEEYVFLGREVARNEVISEATVKEIDEEMRRILADAHEKARQILRENADGVRRIVEALLERETLTAPEIRAIIEGGQDMGNPAEGKAAGETA
ncbi:MAG TPA: ATP-dependent zinc metalloprotease FtsH [Candidatus Brocadiia bacterium]|nr:ATP-dependent zinc metalloprotease FtsH [Candidatus Brocadiia bacterium]